MTIRRSLKIFRETKKILIHSSDLLQHHSPNSRESTLNDPIEYKAVREFGDRQRKPSQTPQEPARTRDYLKISRPERKPRGPRHQVEEGPPTSQSGTFELQFHPRSPRHSFRHGVRSTNPPSLATSEFWAQLSSCNSALARHVTVFDTAFVLQIHPRPPRHEWAQRSACNSAPATPRLQLCACNGRPETSPLAQNVILGPGDPRQGPLSVTLILSTTTRKTYKVTSPSTLF